LGDEDFLVPWVFIGRPQTTLLTGARAFTAEIAASPGKIDLRVVAASTHQNLFRASADAVTALIASVNEGLLGYGPGRPVGCRSGQRATPEQLELFTSHRCSPVLPALITAQCLPSSGFGLDLDQENTSYHPFRSSKDWRKCRRVAG
jgi:hypothetical protein